MKKLLYIVFITIAIFLMTTTVAFAETTVYCASATGDLDLHISADKDSFVLGKVLSCSKMSLIKKNDVWGLVNVGGKTGWVNLSFTRDNYSAAAEATGKGSEKTIQIKQNVKKVSLYSLPSDDKKRGSNEKYSVPAETVLEIIRETESGWGLVPMKNDYAWINLENVKLYKGNGIKTENSGIYYVYTKAESRRGANLYSQNGGGIVLRVIPNCIKLTARKSSGKYLYTSYDGINGWIKASDVTISQEDARTNVGEMVHEEYITTVSSDIYNIPSDQKIDGAVVLGGISARKHVFVQRSTYDGWMLVNNDGIVGWIPPESAEKDMSEREETVQIAEEFKECYIASDKSDGAKMYASYDGKESVLTIPECTKMEIIAQKDNYSYVKSEYASGWVLNSVLRTDFKEALAVNLPEEEYHYYIKEDTPFMTAPAEENVFGSSKIGKVRRGTSVVVKKIVTTGKAKWAYVNIGEKSGWVNLVNAKKEASTAAKVIFAGVTVIPAVLLGVLIVKKAKRRSDKNGKENI